MTTDQTSRVEALCRSYVAAIDRDDVEAVLANFTDDATVTSPIYGTKAARHYFSHLLAITSDQSMALKTVFVAVADPTRAALHVVYTRTVEGSAPATSEAVDIFTLNDDQSRFSEITIIYDTAPVRRAFARAD